MYDMCEIHHCSSANQSRVTTYTALTGMIRVLVTHIPMSEGRQVQVPRDLLDIHSPINPTSGTTLYQRLRGAVCGMDVFCFSAREQPPNAGE